MGNFNQDCKGKHAFTHKSLNNYFRLEEFRDSATRRLQKYHDIFPYNSIIITTVEIENLGRHPF